MADPTPMPVIIIGAGPCGLMLAIELGRRRIPTIVLEEKVTSARFPQANATQARTMEHYRRLGFADQIRMQGLPADYPTDIAYFTRFTSHELARFSLPAARDARQIIRSLSGSWSAAELPHRCSQMFVEQVLRRQAESLGSVSSRPGWRAVAVRQSSREVMVDAERIDGSDRVTLRGSYAVGADGARSLIRKSIGSSYEGEYGIAREFLGGRMFAIYLRSSRLYDLLPHPRAWTYWTLNHDRRSFMFAINGSDEFSFHTQLLPDDREEAVTDARALAMFHAALGKELDVEILSRSAWTAGLTLVADKFTSARIFLAGDAAHLFTPTGGLGYNTAVEDAANLGWKLAATLQGWAGPALLASYQIERQAIAKRNTGYARGFANSIGGYAVPARIEDDGPLGDAARRSAGNYLAAHARAEFNIPGVTFGGRYDGSPIVVSDGTSPPPDAANSYIPTACPGGRPPHMWLSGGRSLFDSFGFDFTLLRLVSPSAASKRIIEAAAALSMSLSVVDAPPGQARDLYGADLALIRPDQVVAWRGNDCADPIGVLKQAIGHPG